MRPLYPVVFGVVGLAITYLVCWLLGIPVDEGRRLMFIAGTAALVVGVLGSLLMRILRGTSFAIQITALATVVVGAMVAGTVAAGNAMLVSTEDAHAFVVVVMTAGVVGMLVAMVLIGRVGTARASLSAIARRIGDGEPPGVDGLQGVAPHIKEFADLSAELEATAARLAASRERERALDAARRELVTWVSHDLRTPLAGIRAITEALEDGIVDEPEHVARYYKTLRTQSDRLATMVDDLFELGRIHAGELQLDMAVACIDDLVSDALAAAEPVAQRNGVAVSGAVLDGPVEIMGSMTELQRVLGNLLANAVRETPAGGQVRVEAWADDGWAHVAVSDTCGGIPEHVLDKVFEAGFRSEHARTPRPDVRSGLGLAIARGFVEAHGGTIDVVNVEGGCRFTVRLPAATTRAPAHPG